MHTMLFAGSIFMYTVLFAVSVLYVSTVPANSTLYINTNPANSILYIGTVAVNVHNYLLQECNLMNKNTFKNGVSLYILIFIIQHKV